MKTYTHKIESCSQIAKQVFEIPCFFIEQEYLPVYQTIHDFVCHYLWLVHVVAHTNVHKEAFVLYLPLILRLP